MFLKIRIYKLCKEVTYVHSETKIKSSLTHSACLHELRHSNLDEQVFMLLKQVHEQIKQYWSTVGLSFKHFFNNIHLYSSSCFLSRCYGNC
jgi:hypothetical protein